MREINEAWSVLGDDRKRAVYDGKGNSGGTGQTKEEHAAELYERATTEEGQGNFENALMLFSGAARAHARPRYMRRAATCAIKAGQLDEAESWARTCPLSVRFASFCKSPSPASSATAFASWFR